MLQMELLLNVAWILVAAALVLLCTNSAAETEIGRRRQLIAVAVLIAILFPVISMSDDLLAVQNAFEADTYQRRVHLLPSSDHPVQPALALLATVMCAGLGFAFVRFISPRLLPVHSPELRGLGSVFNRPPPSAPNSLVNHL